MFIILLCPINNKTAVIVGQNHLDLKNTLELVSHHFTTKRCETNYI